MAERRDVYQYILSPEIKQFDDLQVFEFHGKDARGFDFGVRLSPAAALSFLDTAPEAADADRVNMYAGSDPAHIDDIATEIEIILGDEKEVYSIDSAAMTYVPKGVPYGHRVTGGIEKTSWVLTLTLPPKYVQPEKSEEKDGAA